MLISILISVSAIGLICILWIIPIFQTWPLRNKVNLDRLKELQNEFRKTIAQILGGGLIMVGFFFTWHQAMVIKDKDITERFSMAIGHLDSKHTHVRIGGIYTLQRIMRDFSTEKETVCNILSAFIRDRGKWNDRPISEFLAPDLQAAIQVIGQRPRSDPSRGADCLVDISNTDLRRARFDNSDFSYARMLEVHLESAEMQNINLSYAKLQGSFLDKVNLRNAVLIEADFSYTSIKDAHLEGANLKGVKGLSKEMILKNTNYVDNRTIFPE